MVAKIKYVVYVHLKTATLSRRDTMTENVRVALSQQNL